MGKAVGMRVRGKYCNSQDLLFRIKVSFDLFFFFSRLSWSILWILETKDSVGKTETKDPLYSLLLSHVNFR